MCPYTSNDFTKFWVNSLVVMNEDQWRSNEFTSLMNGDYWIAPTFCISATMSTLELVKNGWVNVLSQCPQSLPCLPFP